VTISFFKDISLFKTFEYPGKRHRLIITASLSTFLGCALALPAMADTSLVNHKVVVTGPIQVRLSFTDQNGAEQDLSLVSLPAATSNALPGLLKQLVQSPLLVAPGHGNGFFDQAWQTIKADVCQENVTQLTQGINNANNQAYNVACTPDPIGALFAVIETQWEDPTGFQVNGTRLILSYTAPYNSTVFNVTTPATCKNANAVCAADPQFTLLFQAEMVLTFTSANSPVPVLLPTDQHVGQISQDTLSEGNNSGTIQRAVDAWAVGLGFSAAASAATLETLGAADLIAQTAQLAAQLAGLGYSSAYNAHLRDTVLPALSSPSAASTALSASGQFDTLWQGLAAATALGFGNLAISQGSDGSLIFRVTKAAGSQPVLTDVTAQANTAPSLIPPAIGVAVQEAKPGSQITVRGSSFSRPETTSLKVGWTNAFASDSVGTAIKTEVDWNVSGGAVQKVSTTQGSYTFDKLQPGTEYQFKVSECDPLSCAPASKQLTLKTWPAGSDKVVFWLDNTSSTTIGTTTVDPTTGGFNTTLTLPANASAGQHTLHASYSPAGAGLPKTEQATATIFVCPESGCTPTIAFINPNTQTVQPPPGLVEQNYSFTLRGDGFSTGDVTVFLDSATGTKLGTKPVAASGTFQSNFTMPDVAAGNHTILAVETASGKTLQASVPVFVEATPQ
jgi:hypothetical protein